MIAQPSIFTFLFTFISYVLIVFPFFTFLPSLFFSLHAFFVLAFVSFQLPSILLLLYFYLDSITFIVFSFLRLQTSVTVLSSSVFPCPNNVSSFMQNFSWAVCIPLVLIRCTWASLAGIYTHNRARFSHSRIITSVRVIMRHLKASVWVLCDFIFRLHIFITMIYYYYLFLIIAPFARVSPAFMFRRDGFHCTVSSVYFICLLSYSRPWHFHNELPAPCTSTLHSPVFYPSQWERAVAMDSGCGCREDYTPGHGWVITLKGNTMGKKRRRRMDKPDGKAPTALLCETENRVWSSAQSWQ